MKQSPLFWVLRQIRKRIPAILLMTAAQMGNALFGVLFALGSSAVIDSAAAGSLSAFRLACLKQGAVIAGMLLCLTVMRHLRERLTADLERDWKQKLLHGLLHGEYAHVSAYHSAELLNRRNNDVAKVDDGVLSISYGRDSVLQDASFFLPKGTFTVITGSSGIGKSTLLKLLLGIFSPEEGRLSLQGKENSITLDRGTRRMFAYVPQGSLLFSGSIRDNLVITNPEASEEEIRQAIYVSAMDEFLSGLPEGLNTVLGENHSGLSEGQAQRLAIARAVLSGAPILLLDECTSALDMETEQLILERLRKLPDRTCIAVTHRTAAIGLSDWNLEIQNGRILQKRIRSV